jgi:hypothetical protein
MSTWLASSFLSKDRIIAKPGFNRWLAAPAALAVHLCIGQVYAFSVFNLPLTKVLGVTESLPEDWKLTTLGWIFSLAIMFLGLSAAFAGKWLEKVGPRVTMFCSALCFSGGFLLRRPALSCMQSGCCIWVTAYWAASVWGWAMCRRFQR